MVEDSVRRRSTVEHYKDPEQLTTRSTTASLASEEDPLLPGEGMSVAACILTMTKSSVGVGLLGLPAKGWDAGWAGILLYCSIAGMTSSFCAVALSDVIDHIKKTKGKKTPVGNLQDICEAVWGRKGKIGMGILFNATCTAICILFMIAIGGMFAQCLPVFFKGKTTSFFFNDENAWRMIMCIVIIPICCLKDMAIIAKCAVVGICASGVTIAAITYHSYLKFTDETLDHSKTSAFKSGVMSNINALVAIVFGYGSVMVVPPVKAGIKNPQSINTAIHGSNIAVTAINAFVCLVSFFGFAGLLGQLDGAYIFKFMGEGTIENNRPESFGAFASSAMIAKGVAMCISYPLVSCGVFEVVEAWKTSLQPTTARCAWRASFVVVTSLFACLGGKIFAPFLCLIAAAFMMPMVYMFPLCANWYLIHQEGGMEEVKRRSGMLAFHGFIFFVVIIACIFGTIGAVKDIL